MAKNLQVFTQRQETFRQDLIELVGKLFDTFSLGVVSLDALMSLFFDMYGHVDAGLRELVRNRLAILFKPHLISTVQGKNLSRQERDMAEAGGAGYLGGDEVVRDRLEKQIKTDELLSKTVEKYKPRFSRGSQQDRDRDKRSEGYQDSEKQKGIFCFFVDFPFLLNLCSQVVMLTGLGPLTKGMIGLVAPPPPTSSTSTTVGERTVEGVGTTTLAAALGATITTLVVVVESKEARGRARPRTGRRATTTIERKVSLISRRLILLKVHGMAHFFTRHFFCCSPPWVLLFPISLGYTLCPLGGV